LLVSGKAHIKDFNIDGQVVGQCEAVTRKVSGPGSSNHRFWRSPFGTLVEFSECRNVTEGHQPFL